MPLPLKRSDPSAASPPSKLASPPSKRAVAPTTVKPLWLKSTRPLAAPSSGLSGLMRTSLPARVRLPFTVAAEASNSGMLKPSFSSAGPLALLCASTLRVQVPTGEVLTKRSMSASGPRAWPSSTSTDRSARLRMPPCTWLSSTPAQRAFALRTSIVARSNTISPLTRLSAGHGDSNAGSVPAAGTLGT